MNRLNLNNVNLHGRSEEFAILQESYQKVKASQCNASEIVMVHGYSGTGKSSLVRKLQRWMKDSDDDNGYFVSGKFNQQRTTEPYYALAESLNELCDLILASNDKDQTRTSFMEAVGSKGKVLLDIVPKLNQIMGDMEADARNKGTTTALNQLKFVFRAFVRTVCTVTKHPIVLFLDDLQWADVASLQLIKSLMSDSECKRILFVGSYRDNEVDETHPLRVYLANIQQENRVRDIPLGNLDEESVNELISKVIELSPSSSKPLSEVVFRKTNGNIFFVLQFLRMLHDQELLYFSLTSFTWAWDIDKIRAQTDLAENVVDLMAGKIERMPGKTRAALKLAACLWSTFDVELLREVMLKGRAKAEAEGVNCESIISADDDLVALLDKAADEGLLDKLGGARYKFAHDRIQQAAYSLVPEGSQRERMHNWVGGLLWEMTKTSRREEWMYFAAADQMNRGLSFLKDDKERVELARLDLLVAEKAISLSAFVPASSYLKAGIDLIPEESRWEEHYDLTLRLYNALVEMEHCAGNGESTENISREILANTKSCKDKISAMYTMGLSLVSQSRHKEASELCYGMLKKLGEPVPTRVTKVVVSIESARLRRLLRGKSDDDLLQIPPMSDNCMMAASRFYHLLYNCKTQLGLMQHAKLVSIRMMKFTLRRGLCEESPLAYVLWGEALVGDGNIQEGYRYGKLGSGLVERLESKSMKAKVVTLASSFLNHWKEPLQNAVEPLVDAHKCAMLTGDTSWAFQCILGYQVVYFYAGLQLTSGVEDLLAFSKQMLEYNQISMYNAQRPVLQTMLNLMARSKDVLQLTGEVMDQEEVMDRKKNPRQLGVQAIVSCRMQLAYYFSDLDLAGELSKQLQIMSKDGVFSASYLVCARSFFVGLISIALARKTNRRKYAKDAQKIMSMMEDKWVKRGAVNCLHKLLLLRAEYATLGNADREEVKEAFDNALSTARRVGFIQDQALGNERAGEFFLRQGDKFWASTYLSRAHELYTEWGAQAKVEQLEKKHGSLIAEHEEQHSSHLHGKQRFSDDSSNSIQRLNKNQIFGR